MRARRHTGHNRWAEKEKIFCEKNNSPPPPSFCTFFGKGNLKLKSTNDQNLGAQRLEAVLVMYNKMHKMKGLLFDDPIL